MAASTGLWCDCSTSTLCRRRRANTHTHTHAPCLFPHAHVTCGNKHVHTVCTVLSLCVPVCVYVVPRWFVLNIRNTFTTCLVLYMLLAHALLTAQRDDGVERRKGHVHSAGLPKCVHYIRHIVENWITRIYHHNRITDAFHKMCLCENTPDKKKTMRRVFPSIKGDAFRFKACSCYTKTMTKRMQSFLYGLKSNIERKISKRWTNVFFNWKKLLRNK